MKGVHLLTRLDFCVSIEATSERSAPMDIQNLEHRCEYSVVLDGVAFYVFDAGRKSCYSIPYLGPLHNHYSCELQYMHRGREEMHTDGEAFL